MNALLSTHVEQVRIGADSGRGERASGFRHHTVGQANRTIPPVIVAGAEQPGTHGEAGVERKRIGQAQLGHIQGGLFLGDADESNQVVDHLGDTERSESGAVSLEKQLDLSGGWLALEKREHRKSVQDAHPFFRLSASASSDLASRRA